MTRSILPSNSRGAWLAGGFAAAIALAFALYTDHRWEDFYITFRASRNLAAGHGLVFQAGERLHTFTSPLGVLLPALASAIVGGGHDGAVLWIFRLICIAAFGGAVGLAWKTGRAWGWSGAACVFLTAWLATDAKSVDFTINGMETGILLFFLALTVHTLASGEGGARRLGLAWAGLMWTRPDGFVSIAALALGCWLFPGAQRLAKNRGELFRAYFRAGLWCALLYAPWFLWAWRYYGSPIPNTVVAKALTTQTAPHGALGWAKAVVAFIPRMAHSGPLEGIFGPIYYNIGGWPLAVLHIARLLAWISLVLFLVPRLRPEARALSVASFIFAFYLAHILPFPWYKPPGAWLAAFAVAGLAEHLSRLWKGRAGGAVWIGAAGAVAFSLTLLCATAWEIRWQQRLIEGQRRAIGLWLRDHRGSDRDTVMLEPLGYIGYFSQLKMYDFQGLSSREILASRRRHGFAGDWVDVISDLKPRWVVCRPSEPSTLRPEKLRWFEGHYHLVKTFDQSAAVAAVHPLPGRSYLQFDQTFRIFQSDEAGAPPPSGRP